jgi:hypothetical protein
MLVTRKPEVAPVKKVDVGMEEIYRLMLGP